METYNDPNSAGMMGAILAIYGTLMIFNLIAYVIVAIGAWKVFEKAGKPGWAAIIPIYNIIVLLEIVGKPTWWVILFLIPCTLPIFSIWTFNLLSKSFGQSTGFTVGLIILPYVFFPILGFGNYQYLGPSAQEAQGFRPIDPSTNYRDPFNTPPPPPPAS